MKRARGFIFLFIFLTLSFLLSTKSDAAESKTNIDLLVMSQCPYSVLVENSFIELRKEFKENININFYFIAGEEKGEFISRGGPGEVEEDIRQLVILKYWPDKFWDYLKIRNTEYLGTNWQPAALIAGLDIDRLSELIKSNEAKDLLRNNIKKAHELKVISSPTIYIDGDLYRSSLGLHSLKLALCKILKISGGTCQGLPQCFEDRDCGSKIKKVGKCQDAGTIKGSCIFLEAPKIELVLLTSGECLEEPEASFLLENLQRQYPGLEIRKLDTSDKEGARLLSDLEIKALPVIIFNEGVTKTDDFQTNINQGAILRLKDPRYYLLSPLVFPPSLFLSRELKPDTLDIFVMSHCPAAIEAEDVLIKRLKDKSDFKLNIHYILNKDLQGRFFSFYGEEELREDIEQIVMRYYLLADKFLEYILCRNQAIKKGEDKRSWQDCVKKLGLEPQGIWEFAYEKNVELLNKEFLLSQELQVQSSPTFIWENRFKITNSENLRKINKFKDLKKIEGSCR